MVYWRLTAQKGCHNSGMASADANRATSQRLIANLRSLRQARGLTTYDLADRLREIGHPIHQTGVSRIETGQRRVDVDDLVALAKVLDVLPADLLFGEVVVSMRFSAPA